MEDFYSKHIGEVYERLTVKSVVRNPRPQFVCSCECGGFVTCDVFSVLHKKTRSCGCLRLEVLKESGKGNLKPIAAGTRFKNKKGLDFEVVEYVTSTRIKIRFVDSGYETISARKEVKKGSIRDWIATPLPPKAEYTRTTERGPINRMKVGEIYSNFYDSKYEVVELLPNSECRIKFLDEFGYEKVTLRSDVKRGIRNPFYRNMVGVGYVGEGDYTPDKDRKVFTLWGNMFTRCYDPKSWLKLPTYKDCEVQEKWHSFQNFARWCYNQPEFLQQDGWCLDKDVIVKGNKIYSEETCAFVPRDINNLFTLRGNKRGEYPLGVHKEGKSGKFIAQINRQGRRICLGRFATPEQAFLVYKEAKEAVVKEIAEKYKSGISSQVYKSLINWKVEVTD